MRHLRSAILVVTVTALAVALTAPAMAKDTSCASISEGTITDSGGNPIGVGFDQFGYNYQAHLFVGTYDSSDRNIDGTYWGDTGDFVDDQLIMKWSNDWLSNQDCDANGKLDRGSAAPYVVSQGWLTNQVSGDYYDADGVLRHYAWFTKIVWVGTGGSLWGQYEIILDVAGDPFSDLTGLQVKVGPPGFGLNDQWTTN